MHTALVLAAGKSTRIQSISSGRPKPLLEVGGQTVLERNLRQLAAAGVSEVWINLHYEGDQIGALIGDGRGYGLHVGYSWEPELLGTAGAAKKLEPVLGNGTFLVVYGDNLTRLDLREMISQHNQDSALVTVAVFHQDRVPNTGLAGGRVVLGDGWRIQRFDEGSGSDSPFVNAGVYVVEAQVLQSIPPYVFQDFGHDVFPVLLAQDAPIYAYPISGYCLGIDTPEALARASDLIGRLEHPEEAHTL